MKINVEIYSTKAHADAQAQILRENGVTSARSLQVSKVLLQDHRNDANVLRMEVRGLAADLWVVHYEN